MPTKAKEKAREQARERMRRMRAKNVTPSETSKAVTPDVTPLPSTGDVTLEAVNAYLESEGLPKVQLGIKPSLPFDKKLQASRKRM